MEIIMSALNLSLFGMGFVFVFLIILTIVVHIMSAIINSIMTRKQQAINIDHHIDEETQFIIKEAIKMHRGGNS